MSVIEVNELTKDYGYGKGVFDINLNINEGEMVGFVGTNGSGKTTLIKLLAGLLTPTSGEVLIEGQAPGPWTKSIVSYLPDHLTVPEWMKV